MTNMPPSPDSFHVSCAVTNAYERPPTSKTSTSPAPASDSSRPPEPCRTEAAGFGRSGLVISIICTPPPVPVASASVPVRASYEAVNRYVLPFICAISVLRGACRAVYPPWPSVTVPATTRVEPRLENSMSTNCRPSSFLPATKA